MSRQKRERIIDAPSLLLRSDRRHRGSLGLSQVREAAARWWQRAVMILIPLALVWAGYTLIWYGWAHITGPRNAGGSSNGQLGQAGGTGCVDLSFKDLISPKQISYCDQWWSQPTAGKSGCAAPTAANALSTAAAAAGQTPNFTNPNQPIYTTPSGQPITGTIQNPNAS
jgi:hypothetical protein